MTTFTQHVEDYLRLRRALGLKLDEPARLLGKFATHLEATGVEVVAIEVALAWAVEPLVPRGGVVPATRLLVVRGFARYLAGVDPRTEIPPTGLIRLRRQRRTPYIYTDEEILALMQQARGADSATMAGAHRAGAAARRDAPGFRGRSPTLRNGSNEREQLMRRRWNRRCAVALAATLVAISAVVVPAAVATTTRGSSTTRDYESGRQSSPPYAFFTVSDHTIRQVRYSMTKTCVEGNGNSAAPRRVTETRMLGARIQTNGRFNKTVGYRDSLGFGDTAKFTGAVDVRSATLKINIIDQSMSHAPCSGEHSFTLARVSRFR